MKCLTFSSKNFIILLHLPILIILTIKNSLIINHKSQVIYKDPRVKDDKKREDKNLPILKLD